MSLIQGGEARAFGSVESVSVRFLLEYGRQHRVREFSAFAACCGGQAGYRGSVSVGCGMLAAAEQYPGHHQPVPCFQRPFHCPAGPVPRALHVPGVLV